MLLSEVISGLEGVLVRDGSFNRLDYCTVMENGPFLSFMEREKFLDSLLNNYCISCVICKPDLVDLMPDHIEGIFVSDEPKAAFEMIHNNLAYTPEYSLPNHDTLIGNNCSISPLAYISEKNVKIGNNVIIEPFVFIGEHVEIGDNCKIYNHATIGGRSFSYARVGEQDVTGLIDCGKVVLEDGVEIMSYSHLARGILPTDITQVGKNSILDAQVHIGHGAKLKERVFVAAHALVGGNTVIGRDSWVGVGATISNRITIGTRCRVSIGSVVTKDVQDGMTVTGNFAVDHKRFISELKEKNAYYENKDIIE